MPNSNDKKIVHCSVVIPYSGDNQYQLKEQLDALSGEVTNYYFELLLICNAGILSNIDLAKYQTSEYFNFQVLHTSEKKSAPYARNFGSRYASGKYLLFCDADDIVCTNWINEICQSLDSADIVGGRIRPFLDTKEFRQLLPPTNELKNKFNFKPFASTCNLGIRTTTFNALNGFDESFLASEDTELCWRAQASGYHIVFNPNAEVCYRLRVTFSACFKQFRNYGYFDFLLARLWELNFNRYFPFAPLVKSFACILFPFLLLKSRYRRTFAVNCGYLVGYLEASLE